MKKVRVKELKNKMKVVRELKRESEADKEIKELTEGEVSFNDVELSRAAGRPNLQLQSVREDDSPRPTTQSAGEASAHVSGARLYDEGKSMGGQAGESKYNLAENITGENRLRTIKIGNDFAMGQSRSDYPEANRIERNLRQEDEKKYSTAMESSTGKRGKRYAWEV